MSSPQGPELPPTKFSQTVRGVLRAFPDAGPLTPQQIVKAIFKRRPEYAGSRAREVDITGSSSTLPAYFWADRVQRLFPPGTRINGRLFVLGLCELDSPTLAELDSLGVLAPLYLEARSQLTGSSLNNVPSAVAHSVLPAVSYGSDVDAPDEVTQATQSSDTPPAAPESDSEEPRPSPEIEEMHPDWPNNLPTAHFIYEVGSGLPRNLQNSLIELVEDGELSRVEAQEAIARYRKEGPEGFETVLKKSQAEPPRPASASEHSEPSAPPPATTEPSPPAASTQPAQAVTDTPAEIASNVGAADGEAVAEAPASETATDAGGVGVQERLTLAHLLAQPFAREASEQTRINLRYAGEIGRTIRQPINSLLFIAATINRASENDSRDTGWFFMKALQRQREPRQDKSAFVRWIAPDLLEEYGVEGFDEYKGADVPETFEVEAECYEVLRVASDMAREAGEPVFNPRHVIGAILSPLTPETVALSRLSRMGFDVPRLRSELIEFIDREHHDEGEAWRKYLGGDAARKPDAQPSPDPSKVNGGEEAEAASVMRASVSDQPVGDDALGFGPYVTAMAEFLTNEKTVPPLTLSIEGEWGSGKSSFMLQLKRELRAVAQRRRMRLIWPCRYEILRREETIPRPLRRLGLLRRWVLPNPPRAEVLKIACPTVSFNAWRHDKEDALWASFALAFVRQLSHQLAWTARPFAHFRLLRLRFDWAGGWFVALRALLVAVVFIFLTGSLFYLLFTGGLESLLTSRPRQAEAIPHPYVERAGTKRPPAAGGVGTAEKIEAEQIFLRLLRGSGVVGYLALTLFLAARFRDYFGNPLSVNLRQYIASPDYDSRVAFIEHFHEDFKKIVETYGGENKVYVFIDDLDRCDVPKAAELMQALNLLIADSPHLVFIIGMDREKVAAGLAVKHKELLPYLAPAQPQTPFKPKSQPAGGRRRAAPPDGRAEPSFDPTGGLEYGYSFIEKFIQLPFRVPQPGEIDLRRLLNEISPDSKSAEAAGASKSSGQDSDRPSEAGEDGRGAAPGEQRAGAAGGAQGAARSHLTGDARERSGVQPGATATGEGGAGGAATAGTTTAGAAKSASITAAQRELRWKFKREAFEDSPEVRQIILMVAPTLDNNPRRIKQFINLFRLNAYIAAETRLNERLTLHQLGKFVALGLRWPRLVASLEDDQKLLPELHDWSLKPDSTDASDKEVVNFWRQRRELLRLLRYGCVEEKDAGGRKIEGTPNPGRFSLGDVEVGELLRVSAKVIPPPNAAEATPPANTVPSDLEES